MQIVNGYVCMNCCDVDKARLGQDPHQSADQLKKQTEQRFDAAGKFGPAVSLGGALGNGDGFGSVSGSSGGAANADASSPASSGGNATPPTFNLNILV